MEHQKDHLVHFWKRHFQFNLAEIRAFASVRRDMFVPEKLMPYAYEDRPLPLLRGKTISQPTTVMIMTHALELEPGEKVFEVGAGSGFQAAIIGKIVGPKGKVVSSEVIPELVLFARQNLKKARINNVQVREDDGAKGMKEEAPFDKIIITAACREFPKELLEQLKPNGVIVGPVGDKSEQEMVRGIKREDGTLALEFLGQFLFTPMYGKYGFEV
ncbi:protein-L-isoaspartate(D-aspartate) O-methyltransferase [Candidatus Woesearchaeota archaeon]|nr:protein-L-isoaspartate(D-aspartate) O-methyltransferase [Candidatus Woesearchaeota archaeon]